MGKYHSKMWFPCTPHPSIKKERGVWWQCVLQSSLARHTPQSKRKEGSGDSVYYKLFCVMILMGPIRFSYSLTWRDVIACGMGIPCSALCNIHSTGTTSYHSNILSGTFELVWYHATKEFWMYVMDIGKLDLNCDWVDPKLNMPTVIRCSL